MPRYEYKIVPAPMRSDKIKGIRAPRDRYALTLAGLMNELAAQGWEYQRAETLPCEEKKGFFSRAQTVFQNVLIFRRMQAEATPEPLQSPHRPAEPAPPVAPEPPTPAAMAASLMSTQPEGTAPRIAPLGKSGSDAPNITRIAPGRVAPEGPERRGE